MTAKKRTMFLQKWILNPQDLLQNRSLETVPVCIVLQYYPHSNTVCSHMYDECMKSIDSSVCHRLWSILWWIVRAYLLTIEYQVFQNVPSISILKHFESILLTIILLLLWSDVHQGMELISCRVVESSFLITHNIAPHISLHDLPYHKTTKRFEYFPSMEIFKLLLRKFAIQTWFCICSQYLCLFHNVFECIPSIHDKGKMLVLPHRLLCWVVSTSDQCFVFSSQFYVIHIHR